MNGVYIEKKDFLRKSIGIIIYKLVIEAAYVFYLSPLFGYNGFTYEFDSYRYVVSWLLCMIFICCVIYTNEASKRKTDLIIEIWVYLCVVPALILYEGNVTSLKCILLEVCYWMLMFVFYNLLGHITTARLCYKNEMFGRLIILATICISDFALLIICDKNSAYKNTNDLYGVYDARTEAGSYDIPTVISYVLGLSCATIPIIITFLFKEKKWIGALFLIVVQMLNFGINGLKSTFAMTIVAIGCYIVIKQKYLKTIQTFFSLFGVACMLEVILAKSFYFIDFLLRRVFFVSSQLSYCYLDYFSTHEPDYFRTSLGRFVGVSSEYSKIPYLIGYEYFNKDVSANCGLIADAVTNLGVVGILVFPLIFAFFLLVLNRCVEYVNEKIYFVAFVYIAYVLNNASFTTALLSHGLIGLMIVLYILSKIEEGELAAEREAKLGNFNKFVKYKRIVGGRADEYCR